MSAETTTWIPWDTYDPAELEGSDALIPEGTHRVTVTSVSKPDKLHALRVGYKVISSDRPSAVGLSSSEMFWLSDGATKRLAILATRLGWRERGQKGGANVDWSRLVGATLVVQSHIEEGTDEKKTRRTKWGFASFWPVDAVDAPRAASAPAALAPQRNARPQPEPVTDFV